MRELKDEIDSTESVRLIPIPVTEHAIKASLCLKALKGGSIFGKTFQKE